MTRHPAISHTFQRESTEPLRVSVTGIDGSGKDTTTLEALRILNRDEGFWSLKVGRPSVAVTMGEQVTEMFPRVTTAFDRLYSLSNALDSKMLLGLTGIAYHIMQTRYTEQKAVSKNCFDIIASSRDPLLDLLVYGEKYGEKLSTLSPEKRLHIIRRLTSASRDLIIFLDTDPETAAERIDDRQKKHYPHETVEELSLLHSSYQQHLPLISTATGIPVTQIQTRGKDFQSVAAEIAQHILDRYRSHEQGN